MEKKSDINSWRISYTGVGKAGMEGKSPDEKPDDSKRYTRTGLFAVRFGYVRKNKDVPS